MRLLFVSVFACCAALGPPRTAVAAVLQPEWAPYVAIEELRPSDQNTVLQAMGRLGYDQEHTQTLRSPISGRVTKVWVTLGDTVKVGQPLLSILSPEAGQLKAELQKDEQDVQMLGRALARAKSLLADGAVSPREIAEAEAAYNKAVAERARDAAHVEALGLDVHQAKAEARVLARQDGVVTTRDVVVGQEIRSDAEQELLTISNLDSVWLWANVFERDLGEVDIGAPVSATVAAWPQTTFCGSIDYIGDVVEPQSNTIKVRARLDNKKRQLKPQMFAKVGITQKSQGRLWLSSQAVITRGEEQFAVVVGAQDSLRLSPLRLGALRQGKHAVQAGLQAGDRVVVKGALLVAATLQPER